MYMTFMRTTLIALLAIFAFPTFAESKFTGTYMSNARPHELIHLALTQTQNSIAGAMTMVTPDKEGGLRGQTMVVRGTADGNAISIIAERSSSNLAITGRKNGSIIALTFPGTAGNLATRSFEPASEKFFNGAVTKWRQELSANHNEQLRLKAQEAAEQQLLERLSRILERNVSAIKATEIGHDLSEAKAALQRESAALRELEGKSVELKRSATVSPMTCYQAYETVAYNFHQTMGHIYKQDLGYANSQFRSATSKLEQRLMPVNGMTEEIEKNALELREAIRLRKFPLPRLVMSPGEEKAPLEEYKLLARSSEDQLPALKAQNEDILAKAKELMQDGKLMVETAKGLVRCRY